MVEEKVGLRFVVDGRGSAVSAFGSVRSSLISTRGAAIALGGALYGVGRALSSSIDEAREAERVGKVTEQRLKTTHRQANITAGAIGNLAGAISRKTGIDDESIQAGQNMLLMFGRIRNEQGKGNKIFNRSTQAVVDYAAAMGGGKSNSELDLTTAARTVGRALNDPIKGLTLLSKGTKGFTDGEKEKVKALVATGHSLEAQRFLLDRLAESQRGTAAAQATMGDKVSVAWGNIQEQLGTSLLPLLDRAERAFMREGVPAITHWLDVFDDKGIPAITRFADTTQPLAEELIPAIGSGLKITANALERAAPYAERFIGAFNDMSDETKALLVGGAGLMFLRSRANKSNGALGSVLGKYGGATPVFVVNKGFGPANGIDLPGDRRRDSSPDDNDREHRSRDRGDRRRRGGGVGNFLSLDDPLTWVVGGGVGVAYLLNKVSPEDTTLTVSPGSGAAGVPTGNQGINALPDLYRGPSIWERMGIGKTSDPSIYNLLLTNPGAAKAALEGIRAQDKAMIGLVRSAKSGSDAAADVQRQLFGLAAFRAEPTIRINGVDVARSELRALQADAAAAVNAIRSGFGLFDGGGRGGGGGGEVSPEKPHGPTAQRRRVPTVVLPRSTAGPSPQALTTADAGPIHVHVDLDGKNLTTVVVDRLQDEEARR